MQQVANVAAAAGLTPADPGREYSGNSEYSEVLNKFKKLFCGLPPRLPPEGGVHHHIDLEPGARPKARPPYRLSKFEEEECARQLN